MQNEKQEKKKRFYKKGQMIWSVDLKKEVEVLSVNKEDLTITVSSKDGENGASSTHTFPLWSVDVLKYKAKEKLSKSKNEKSDEDKLLESLGLVLKLYNPTVYFAKVRDEAVIPSKRKEDAGYDIYAELSEFKRAVLDGDEQEDVYEIECPVLATTLVPTGLATAMPNTHYLNLKHERGSTGVQSMSVLAGVVDSGFRNEMFIALTPLHKSVIITSAVDKVEVNDTHILYPLSKAIAQATVDIVPDAKIEVISLEELQNIPSERGMTMLGQSGK